MNGAKRNKSRLAQLAGGHCSCVAHASRQARAARAHLAAPLPLPLLPLPPPLGGESLSRCERRGRLTFGPIRRSSARLDRCGAPARRGCGAAARSSGPRPAVVVPQSLKRISDTGAADNYCRRPASCPRPSLEVGGWRAAAWRTPDSGSVAQMGALLTWLRLIAISCRLPPLLVAPVYAARRPAARLGRPEQPNWAEPQSFELPQGSAGPATTLAARTSRAPSALAAPRTLASATLFSPNCNLRARLGELERSAASVLLADTRVSAPMRLQQRARRQSITASHCCWLRLGPNCECAALA